MLCQPGVEVLGYRLVRPAAPLFDLLEVVTDSQRGKHPVPCRQFPVAELRALRLDVIARICQPRADHDRRDRARCLDGGVDKKEGV